MKTMMMMAALLAPAAAFADDVPGGPNTGATLPISGGSYTQGSFEAAQDSDWYRVKLLAGHDYAVSGYVSDGAESMDVRNAAGGVVASMADPVASGESGGLEFRAPYTGYFFVEARQESGAGAFPLTYQIRVSHDCLASVNTKCPIAVGQTRGAASASAWDGDWLRTTLAVGSSYDVTLALRGGLEECVDIRDANGSIVSGGIYDYCSTSQVTISGFRAPASGTYYVEILPTDDGGDLYSVTLSATTASAKKHPH